ncbi:hypothetical protein KL949_000168 [Ogataea haglerorum]|nr:hypothetical protein KL913_000601 [Ogataea haglerorum]KAG7723118.1 hypothetical protein KL949_000168 [Ogataea haglerorum]KAG7772259.1 hypothetical protein KL931_000599 [Ogataea haglerorum]
MEFSKVYPLQSRAPDASVKQPKELISYSRDIEGQYRVDDSQLSYFYLPDSQLNVPGGIDLQAGFKDFRANGEDFGEFTGLLAALEAYERKTGAKTPANIITWRGLMRSLMLLPFDNRDKIVLNIVVFDGQLFIQQDFQNAREAAELEKLTQSDLNKRQIYSGYKFEKIATLPKPWAECSRKEIEQRNKLPVNNIEQYATVVKTSFGKTGLVMGAEVDCVFDYKPEDADPLSHYVELKTTRVLDSPQAVFSFENKLLKFWAQCFLVGIPKIICGFRDDNMILRTVEEYKTEQIPLMIKNNPLPNRHPSKNKFMQSLKFFNGLINWINETIPRDETKTYRLVFDPAVNPNYLNLSENNATVTTQLLDPETGLISKTFRDWRTELRSK